LLRFFSLTRMFYRSHLFSSVRHAGRKKEIIIKKKKLKDLRKFFSLKGTFW
jgi:hypothetical protein